MINLNDKQADKICEILDYRFHHYNQTNYDNEPCYTFWPESVCNYSHKINRNTGELIFDEFTELSIEFMILSKEISTKLGKDPIIDKLNDYESKKSKIKNYLISENLI